MCTEVLPLQKLLGPPCRAPLQAALHEHDLLQLADLKLKKKLEKSWKK